MVLILVVLSPIIVPLWGIATGLFCIRIGQKTESVRLGWFFFLTVGLLPVGATFALLGAIIPAIVVAAIAGLIIILMILDWYGDDLSDPDPTRDQVTR
ncbi:hypothetical protein [Streptomyces cyslabdanicus]|uniref:hypothetical protein n=1 Tax=Streptomyces cyslabdanicus TaxID=1470456 RepID=UPI004044DBBB